MASTDAEVACVDYEGAASRAEDAESERYEHWICFLCGELFATLIDERVIE